MLTDPEIDALVARVVDRIQPEKVMVFGSYAKGTAHVASDLDLCVILETSLPHARRADSLRPLLGGYLVPVDVHVYTPDEVREYGSVEHSFLHSVMRSGRVVYEAGRLRRATQQRG